jgi:hypothetical protein|tara:strand:- start:12533 stop:14680 length:2148 start_codon:yes stop_codon:yes gene_type:complete
MASRLSQIQARREKSDVVTASPTSTGSRFNQILERRQQPTQELPVEGEPTAPTGKEQGIFGSFVSGVRVGIPQAASAIKSTGALFLTTQQRKNKEARERREARGLPLTPLMERQKKAELTKEEGGFGGKTPQEISKQLQVSSHESLAKADEIILKNFPIDDQRKFTEKIRDPNWIAQGIGMNAPNLLASLGMGAVATAVTGGNVPAGLVAAFGTTFTLEAGAVYSEALSLGADEQTAANAAFLTGTANGMLDIIPIGNFLTKSPVGSALRRNILSKVLKDILLQGGLEAGTESMQEIVANAIGKTYDENRELFQGVDEAAFFGGILGLGTSLPGATGDVVSDARRRSEKRAADAKIAEEDADIDTDAEADLQKNIKFHKEQGGFSVGTETESAPLRDINTAIETTEGKAVADRDIQRAIEGGDIKVGEDGKITLFRAGEVGDANVLTSTTFDESVAKQFQEEAKLRGQDIPLQKFSVSPEDVSVFIGGAESEVLIRGSVVKPTPTPTQAEVKPKKQVVTVPRSQLPIKDAKAKKGVSRLEARIKGIVNLDNVEKAKIEAEEKGLDITIFDKISKPDQIRKASEYVHGASDQDIIDIIKGDKEPPRGILGNSVLIAAIEKAKLDKNTGLAAKIGSLKATRLGQEIGILSEIDKLDAVSAIETIVRARAERVKKSLKGGESIRTQTASTKTSIDKAEKAGRLKIAEAKKILNEIVCD